MTIMRMYNCIKWPIWVILLVCSAATNDQGEPFLCENGVVTIRSEATLELIQAKSNQLRGIIDPMKQTFVWKVNMSTLQGFNSPLQREHFNESYLESDKYQQAIFSGKIIESVNFDKDGKITVRAKGKLNIHGIEQERIIKSTLDIKGNKIIVRASFTVPISDHDIKIPKIVHQKIAEEISVTINAQLEKQ